MRSASTLWRMASLFIVLAMSVQAWAADKPAPAAATKRIQGRVTYGSPIAKITVTLDGAVKKTVKTDDDGQFVFSDLPAGDYTLEAKGIAKNNYRKGSAKVTVPEPPKQLAAVTIKLE